MSERSNIPRDEEAANWFATRRRGVMSLEERRTYDAWVGQKANASALGEMEQTWDWLSVAQGQFADGKTMPTLRRARANPALVAAMCALCLGIGILSYSGDNQFWTTLDWTAR